MFVEWSHSGVALPRSIEIAIEVFGTGAVEQYALANGMRLGHCYVDDAISGTSAIGRKAFQQMIADARSPARPLARSPARPFTVVIAYDVKRFGRVDNDEAGYWRHLLRSAGVSVHYATENFTGDGTGDLLRPVKQWQARQESKVLAGTRPSTSRPV